jgi:GWxTD domain-containing protein
MSSTHNDYRVGSAAFLLLLCLLSFSARSQSDFPWPGRYKSWLNRDVRWIITAQERSDFKKLTDDRQREQFIADFWERRNPMPGTSENGFKQEHYRRIAYADVNFVYSVRGQNAVAGWKSDRGRVYIVYGPPATIESHPAGVDATGATTRRYEVWHYNSIEGMGEDVTAEFVDTCGCGNYYMTVDPAQKNPMR